MVNIIKERVFDLVNFKFDGEITLKDFDGVYVNYDGKNAVIGYSTKAQLARGCFLLAKEVEKKKTAFTITQKAHFDYCGAMLDVSRGGVMTTTSIKKYINYMAALGFNTLMLYTEDVYEIEEYPLFGYMRGRYSVEELKEIDDYAYEMGIEVIPCIQVLGHLNQYLRWDNTAEYRDDTVVLLAGEKKTYDLIRAAISVVRKAFRSDRIHLGMDEAKTMGSGRYLTLNGYKDRAELFNEHLNKVVGICKEHGYSPMIWSDMYFYNPLKEDYAVDTVIPQSVIDAVPEVSLVFWDYYHKNIEFYDVNIQKHKNFNKEVVYAGSVWTAQGFLPNMRHTFETMQPALQSCLKNSIKFVLATLWNDGGWETNYMTAICGLPLFSEYCYLGEECRSEEIYDTIRFLTKMDKPLMDAVSDFHLGYDALFNVGRGLIYCDLMLDTLCIDVDFESAKNTYSKALTVFENYKEDDYYDYYKVLFEICREKSDVLLRLRKAYKEGNKDYLKDVTYNIIPKLERLNIKLFNEFKTIWNKTNKPNGFEVFCHRFGGIDLRLTYVAEVIDEYLQGKRTHIEELEQEPLSGINQMNRYANDFTCTLRQ